MGYLVGMSDLCFNFTLFLVLSSYMNFLLKEMYFNIIIYYSIIYTPKYNADQVEIYLGMLYVIWLP